MTANTWGGSRPGSGRPTTGRKRVFVYLTDEEEKILKSVLTKKRNLEKKMLDMLQAYPGENNEPVYYINSKHGDPIAYTGTVVYREGTEDAWALSDETLQEMIKFYHITEDD